MYILFNLCIRGISRFSCVYFTINVHNKRPLFPSATSILRRNPEKGHREFFNNNFHAKLRYFPSNRRTYRRSYFCIFVGNISLVVFLLHVFRHNRLFSSWSELISFVTFFSFFFLLLFFFFSLIANYKCSRYVSRVIESNDTGEEVLIYELPRVTGIYAKAFTFSNRGEVTIEYYALDRK